MSAKSILKRFEKTAKKDMPGFLSQDRPKKVKEIYSALKREHPDMPAEMKARIAARQGKKGKQEQGPPYKGPIKPWKEKTAKIFGVEPNTDVIGSAALPYEKRIGAYQQYAGKKAKEEPTSKALAYGTGGVLGGLAGGLTGAGLAKTPRGRLLAAALGGGLGAAGGAALGRATRGVDIARIGHAKKVVEDPERAHAAVENIIGESIRREKQREMLDRMENRSRHSEMMGALQTSPSINTKVAAVTDALNNLWLSYAPDPEDFEKNAAAQYFYDLQKPTLDAEALGKDFCKLAESFDTDPWWLACEVEDNLEAFPVLTKTASSFQARELAQFYMNWADGLEKKAIIGAIGRLGSRLVGRTGMQTAAKATTQAGRQATGLGRTTIKAQRKQVAAQEMARRGAAQSQSQAGSQAALERRTTGLGTPTRGAQKGLKKQLLQKHPGYKGPAGKVDPASKLTGGKKPWTMGEKAIGGAAVGGLGLGGMALASSQGQQQAQPSY